MSTIAASARSRRGRASLNTSSRPLSHRGPQRWAQNLLTAHPYGVAACALFDRPTENSRLIPMDRHVHVAGACHRRSVASTSSGVVLIGRGTTPE